MVCQDCQEISVRKYTAPFDQLKHAALETWKEKVAPNTLVDFDETKQKLWSNRVNETSLAVLQGSFQGQCLKRYASSVFLCIIKVAS